MGKLFKSYEMAGLFFPLYAKSMGFCVRIGKMRKIVLEKLRIDSNTTVKGVTALNLIVCARDFGFDAKGLKVDDISKYTFPLIIF